MDKQSTDKTTTYLSDEQVMIKVPRLAAEMANRDIPTMQMEFSSLGVGLPMVNGITAEYGYELTEPDPKDTEGGEAGVVYQEARALYQRRKAAIENSRYFSASGLPGKSMIWRKSDVLKIQVKTESEGTAGTMRRLLIEKLAVLRGIKVGDMAREADDRGMMNEALAEAVEAAELANANAKKAGAANAGAGSAPKPAPAVGEAVKVAA